jgi:hypothetical protein
VCLLALNALLRYAWGWQMLFDWKVEPMSPRLITLTISIIFARPAYRLFAHFRELNLSPCIQADVRPVNKFESQGGTNVLHDLVSNFKIQVIRSS